MFTFFFLIQTKKIYSNEFSDGYQYELGYIDTARNNVQWYNHFKHSRHIFIPIVLPNEYCSIESTSFAHIYSSSGSGAIITFGPLKLKNTFFFNCQARTGSAIKSSNNLVIEQSSFKECRSTKLAGIIEQAHPASNIDLTIRESTTFKSNAPFSAVLYRKSYGNAKIVNSNISNSESSDEVGGFYFSLGTVEIEDTHFNNVSSIINGCFYLEDSVLFRMCDSVFLNVSAVSKRRGTSTCITLTNISILSMIKVTFCDSSDGRTTVSASGGKYGTIKDCLFSKSKETAISLPNYILVNNSEFNYKCKIASAKKNIGFKPKKLSVISKICNYIHFDSLAFVSSFLIASIISYLIIRIKERIKKKRKWKSGESYEML